MEEEKPWPLVPSPESPRPVRLETQESVQTRLGDPGPGWGGAEALVEVRGDPQVSRLMSPPSVWG